jgi:hypothetical protein
MVRLDDIQTQPASLAAIQIAVMEVRDRQDYQGGVLAALDVLIRSHVASEERRPRMSPRTIKAWLGGTAGILAILVGGLTQWRVAQAGAESRHSAEVAAEQAMARRNEIDREKLAQQTAELTAKRTAEEVRRAIREEQAEVERRAAMRIAPTRAKR